LVAQLQEIFRMAQSQVISKDQVRSLIENCFASLVDEVDGRAFLFADPAREVHEQRRMVDERLQDLRGQIGSGDFEREVQRRTLDLLDRHGFNPDGLSDGLRRDLAEGVARALAEQARLYEFRLGERLLPYEPTDPLFARAPTHSQVPPQTKPEEVVGPTVREAVDRYLRAMKSAWVPKTLVNRKRQLDLLVEHLGPSRRLGSVGAEDMRAFRDGLLKMRRNHHVGASVSFIGRQTDNEAVRVEPKTALLQLQNSRTFLRWAMTEGYLEKDPSAGLKVKLPKMAKTKKARRSFTHSDLTTLFSAPTFTGCRSPRRRNDKGSLVLKDAQYWLPLLGYYTGARMGELVQLHVSDLHLDDPIPFIEVTDAGSGELGSGTEKHVKSAAGIRKVPLHPDLGALGFKDFVRTRSKDPRASKRLFFEIAYGRDGQASTIYSKRFARLLDSAGLTDPALVFHSFRHTAEDALRNAKEPPYVIDRIIGHADDAISAQYGEGVSLDIAAAAIEDMKLPLDPKPLLLGK
jgi:integrase